MRVGSLPHTHPFERSGCAPDPWGDVQLPLPECEQDPTVFVPPVREGHRNVFELRFPPRNALRSGWEVPRNRGIPFAARRGAPCMISPERGAAPTIFGGQRLATESTISVPESRSRCSETSSRFYGQLVLSGRRCADGEDGWNPRANRGTSCPLGGADPSAGARDINNAIAIEAVENMGRVIWCHSIGVHLIPGSTHRPDNTSKVE